MTHVLTLFTDQSIKYLFSNTSQKSVSLIFMIIIHDLQKISDEKRNHKKH